MATFTNLSGNAHFQFRIHHHIQLDRASIGILSPLTTPCSIVHSSYLLVALYPDLLILAFACHYCRWQMLGWEGPGMRLTILLAVYKWMRVLSVSLKTNYVLYIWNFVTGRWYWCTRPPDRFRLTSGRMVLECFSAESCLGEFGSHLCSQ